MSAAPPPRCSLIYLPLPKAVPLLLQFLQNAPRDAEKLRRLLEIKERQKEEAMHIEDTGRLVVIGITSSVPFQTASAAPCPSNYEKGPRGTCVGEPIDFVCPSSLYIEDPDDPNGRIYNGDPNPGEEIDLEVDKVGVCSAGTYVAPETEEDTGKCIAPRGEHLD